jgi:4-aminobutyrate aminotransferase
VGRGGVYGNVLRISPPLSVTAEEIDEAATAITDTLTDLTRNPGG